MKATRRAARSNTMAPRHTGSDSRSRPGSGSDSRSRPASVRGDTPGGPDAGGRASGGRSTLADDVARLLSGSTTLTLSVLAAVMNTLLDALPADLAPTAPDALADLGKLLPVSDRLAAVIAQATTLADADGRWALDGSRSLTASLTKSLPVTRRHATTLATTGQALRDHLSSCRIALRHGTLGWDSAQALMKATTSQATIAALDILVPPEATIDTVIGLAREATTKTAGDQALADWVRCEDWLIGRAQAMSVYRFTRLLASWVAMVDPEACERAYRESEADAHIAAAQTLDCCHIQGKLAPEGGKVLLAALDAFRPTYDADNPTGIEERNAQALETIARIALETNLAGDSASARPHVGLTISWETFCAMATSAGNPTDQLAAMADLPPAMWADGTGPIPHSVTASIVCDSDITRIVFGPRGQLINLGRTNRVITPGLRAAIVARDEGCGFPGCDAPPILCQVHHAHHWSHGGKTDASNLVLLCRYHHRWVHANNITIRPPAGPPTGADPPAAHKPANNRESGSRPPDGANRPPDRANQPADRAARPVHGTPPEPRFEFVHPDGRLVT